MTDLLVPFNDLLKQHSTHTAKDIYYSIERVNEFLKEAYRIVCDIVTELQSRRYGHQLIRAHL